MTEEITMGKGMFWDILIQYIFPILLIGLGILALVLIIIAVVCLVDVIKDWIEAWRE